MVPVRCHYPPFNPEEKRTCLGLGFGRVRKRGPRKPKPKLFWGESGCFLTHNMNGWKKIGLTFIYEGT